MEITTTELVIKIRQATIEDIPPIIEVEKLAWGEKGAATKEAFESRIKTFPEGTLIALIDDKIVGVIVTQIINYNKENPLKKNWYEITDNGFIAKTHNPNGDTLYGVNLSVHPQYQNMGIGRKLMEFVGKLIIKRNLKQGVLGGRIPDYHKFANKITAEDYIKIDEKNKNNIPPDPELLFYQKEYWKIGLRVVKVMPNYFQDPDSLDYGVLLLWKNPFYNKRYRYLAAKRFKAY
jgi:ribosomal protein S18 acetylase RimI-like enzyme